MAFGLLLSKEGVVLIMRFTPSAFGLYPSSKALSFGAEALRAASFRHTDISVMFSDGAKAFRLQELDDFDGSILDESSDRLGGLISALSGIRAVELQNDGPFLAAGPILATLAQANDGLVESLRGLGVPEAAVECFEGRLKQGHLLLSVQCDDDEWAARARQILQETGAAHVAASCAPTSA